ncbi:hypothetical protein Tco_0607726 [Tanacetum coccineum]
MKRMTSKGKGVVIEETMDHDVNDAIGKEFDVESGTIVKLTLLEWNRKNQARKDGTVEGYLETWFCDVDVDQVINVECQDDLYHLVDEPEEPEEICDMFAKLDKALDELDQVIEAENVIDLFAIYDQAIDDVGDVVPVEMVAEEMVAKVVIDGDDGEQVVYDRDVIPNGLYAVIVAQKEVFSTDDGDVIPDEVVDEVLEQKGVWPVDDGDVIPDEVVAEKMLEEHTRLIKRKRVMVDKENEDDSQ